MKRRKWRAALTALLLLAAVGGLLWCFFPRSMMEGELYCVTLWDGQARVDLTDRADREAVTERIARCPAGLWREGGRYNWIGTP